MPYIGKEPAKVPVTAADIPDNSITAAKIVDGAITIADIADDAVTEAKLANAINSAIAANTAKTGITSGQASAITANTAKTGISSAQTSAITANTAKTGITTAQADAITANTAKTGITSGQASAITANTAKVTNATHSGEVTGATALTIADNIVDEANLKISNAPTNGYALTAQSGNTGGLTWAEIGGGPSLGTNSIIRTNAQTISENITIGSTTNGMSAGPITIADGYTITVNGNWSVV